MVKAIIFDYGGTLANSDTSWETVSRNISGLLSRRDIELDPNDFYDYIMQSVEWRKEVNKTGREIDCHEFFNYALSKFGVEASLDETDEMEMYVYENSETEWLADLDVLLPSLANNYKIGLLSNAWLEAPRRLLREMEYGPWFDAMVCSFDIAIPKPDPKIFTHILMLLGVDANEAVMIGDSIEADMEGALACGLKTVWVDPEKSGKWSGPTVRTIAELPEILDEL